jgi:hypothetical protein
MNVADDATPVESAAPAHPGLAKADGASTVPTKVPAVLHGDWVLFHPVYANGEVDAVKVRFRDVVLLRRV